MKTLLCPQDVWEYVANVYTKPINDATKQALTSAQNDQLKDHRKKDAKALHLIQNALDESIFPNSATVIFSKTSGGILEINY